MAGRQSHKKKRLDETSLDRYKAKMYAMFKPVVGEENARKIAEEIAKVYERTFVQIYHKVHADPELESYISNNIGSAKSFLVYQLENEFVSSVLLTRNETASMVLYKYKERGLPLDVIQWVMARVTQIIAPEYPPLMAYLGERAVTPNNVVNLIDNYVLSAPPMSRSYAGKGLVTGRVSIPSRYPGTPTFSSLSEAGTAVDEIKELVARLA